MFVYQFSKPKEAWSIKWYCLIPARLLFQLAVYQMSQDFFKDFSLFFFSKVPSGIPHAIHNGIYSRIPPRLIPRFFSQINSRFPRDFYLFFNYSSWDFCWDIYKFSFSISASILLCTSTQANSTLFYHGLLQAFTSAFHPVSLESNLFSRLSLLFLPIKKFFRNSLRSSLKDSLWNYPNDSSECTDFSYAYIVLLRNSSRYFCRDLCRVSSQDLSWVFFLNIPLTIQRLFS